MHKDDSTYSIDITLAQDEIFVAGDNRPGSVDSRVNGPVKLAQLIGIVAYH
jgi:type IV secretory pathway protease TraF